MYSTCVCSRGEVSCIAPVLSLRRRYLLVDGVVAVADVRCVLVLIAVLPLSLSAPRSIAQVCKGVYGRSAVDWR